MEVRKSERAEKEGKTSYSTDKEAVVRKLVSLTHRNI